MWLPSGAVNTECTARRAPTARTRTGESKILWYMCVIDLHKTYGSVDQELPLWEMLGVLAKMLAAIRQFHDGMRGDGGEHSDGLTSRRGSLGLHAIAVAVQHLRRCGTRCPRSLYQG